jgi:MFS family permease
MTNSQIAQRNVNIHYLSNFTDSRVFIIPVWVVYELQYITLAQLTLVEAIIQGSQLFLELPTGALADLWGKRTTVLLGYLISITAGIAYALSRSFDSFLIYALLAGLGAALISGAREAWLYDSLKAADRENDYSKVTSKGSLIFQIGIAVATISGGVLGSVNILYPIIANVLAIAVTATIFFFAKEPKIDTEVFTLKNYLRQTRMGLAEIKKSSHVLAISLFYIGVGGISWAAMMVFNATLMTQTGFSALEFGITLASIRILNSVILFTALKYNRLFNPQKPFLFISLIMLVSYLPGIYLTKFLTIFAISGSVFSSTFRNIILSRLVNLEYSSKNRATAISTLSMVISIIVVLLSLISGPIMSHFDGAKTMFTFMGILSLISVFPLAIHLHRHPTQVPIAS